MKFAPVSALTMAVLPTAFAAPVAAPSLEQSPNVNALTERQVQIWVWACDTDNFTGNCGAVQNINLNQCYSWSSLFPGIGNGSFKTNGNVLFYDGGGCSGTHSNRVCNTEISRHDYWYDHTQSISSFSTMAACDH
ncbi:uncharacterized protein E0L32_011193 [Thyridium curvatum]|uniref:Uncharacterized protein n=1 Tax=Thyridium curvatum TaxID=1093900 RepID=A0A507BQL5_9PEZI|nr:uncharacterized protein E0L32_011193 [Thyridium curvatum]TPX19120.1 hypothetical protein E0L32_011193 [Thyridium curvatum]